MTEVELMAGSVNQSEPSISAVRPQERWFVAPLAPEVRVQTQARVGLRAGLLAVLLLSASTAANAAAVSPIGTNQRTLVICIRYTDALTTRRANCSDWVTLLNSETNTFYNRTTFNQTNFQFETIAGAGAPTNGWLDLAYAGSGYSFFGTGQDAINLADPFANFSLYNRVLVITSWTGFGGQGGGPWWWRTAEGIEATFMEGGMSVGKRLMTLAIVNEWLASSFGNPFDEGASVAAHELGHQLGAPTHYGGLTFAPATGRDTITPWDIMGLSPTLNHFLGYPKADRGWVPSGPRIVPVGPPTGSAIDTTISLQPLEQTSTAAQIIRIPFTSIGPFIGYLVENRRQINGDERLPGQGVIITAVDETPNSAVRAFVMDNPVAPGNLNAAALGVGGVFTDPSRNLTVSVLSQTSNVYSVRVQYGLPPAGGFDPAITPWGAPPWETQDIWIDSPKNGWDTYRYTDSSGNPTGNGDDAWINHDNRVYVKIRNAGAGPANNVRVRVYSNSPPGMGDAGPNWDFLGTIIFPSIAGGATAQSFVIWQPTVAAHTCIKAVIEEMPGETLVSNNLAQENVTAFDSSPSSPFEPVQLKTFANNPFDRDTDVHIHVRDVPTGWGVLVEPQDFRLGVGERRSIYVAIFPSGLVPCDPKSDRPKPEQNRVGFVGVPKIEAQVPWEDTFIPIGGIDIRTNLVRRTTLTCHLAGHGYEPTTPRVPAKKPQEAGLMPRGEPSKPPTGYELPQKRPALGPTRLYDLAPIVKRPEPVPEIAKGPAVIEGQLTPGIAGAVIAVEFYQRGGKRPLLYTKTGQDGRYHVRVDGSRRGLWTAQSFFAGTTELAAAESGFCSLTVSAGQTRSSVPRGE